MPYYKNMDNKIKLLNIKQASEMLGVSMDTLRRWDESGKLKSIRVKKGQYDYRFYNKDDVNKYLTKIDLFKSAKKWAEAKKPKKIVSFYHSSNMSAFNGRLSKLEFQLMNIPEFVKLFSLLVLVTGEIGNNSFDHNLGNWPDVMGVFFGYNIDERIIVLADRGQGILKTLKRAKPDLTTHKDALRVAFTEFITGRIPEKRGNGLKKVKEIITKNNFKLSFQTGNALLNLKGGDNDLNIKVTKSYVRGCLTLFNF